MTVEAERWNGPDGLVVGYARYGTPGGKPALYLHGWPGSRLEGRLLEGAADALGIEIFALDRPGIGQSRFTPAIVTVADWARVAAAFAVDRGFESYLVAAVSGGGPYALALAAQHPDRIGGVVIAGCAPCFHRLEGLDVLNAFDAALLRCWQRMPVLGGPLMRILKIELACLPFAVVNWPRARFLSPPDRTVLARADVARAIRASMREALAAGPRGVLADLERLLAPWDVEGAGFPGVRFVFGAADRVVAPTPAAASLGVPPERLEIVPDEGHYSLPIRHARDLLGRL